MRIESMVVSEEIKRRLKFLEIQVEQSRYRFYEVAGAKVLLNLPEGNENRTLFVAWMRPADDSPFSFGIPFDADRDYGHSEVDAILKGCSREFGRYLVLQTTNQC